MELSKFLVKAKIATYASEGEANERVLEDGAKELTFEDGKLKYRDRYYGFNPFVGEEIVWKAPAEPKVLGLSNYTGNLNKTAIVTLLKFEDFQALLTGDVGMEEEEEFLPALGEVEVLKVGHHGSKYSTSEELLAVTRPRLAVISVGANNHHGHPAAEVLTRLQAIGAQIRRTDLEGEVEVVSDGRSWYSAN